MNYSKCMSIFAVSAVVGLAGCAAQSPTRTGDYPEGSQYPTQSQYPPYGTRYGYVQAVEVVGEPRREGPGIGAVGGAVAGGVLGNQVGHGSGRAAATVGGAVLGGVVGHQVEKHVRGPNDSAYRFRIQMDDGSYQTVTQEQHDNIRVGDRVRVENGRVWRS